MYVSLTMIYDRMEPLTPISEPTVVRSGLSSMKPEYKAVKCHTTGKELRERTFSDKREARIGVQHRNDHSLTTNGFISTYHPAGST